LKTQEKIKFKKLWLTLGIIYTVIMIALCLIPTNGTSSSVPHLDKVFHFGAHFIWTYWFSQIYSDKRRLILLSLVLGGIIEILQNQTGYRSAEPLDVMANFIGAAAGVIPMLPRFLLKLEKRL